MTGRRRWRGWVKTGWREHGLPLLLYTLFSIALSWPVVAHFSTALAGDGVDSPHNLWVMWYTREFLTGHQPLFDVSLIYYPYGASLLTHGLGPVTGVMALPFWPWGAEAAHNGAMLLSMVLTGYFMYLLAREVGANRPAAFFAGLLLLAAPMHLVGIKGHITKVFLGLMPLALWAFLRTLDTNRRPWWAVVTALVVLAALLHTGTQLVFLGLAMGVLAVFFMIIRPGAERIFLLRRLVWLGLWMLVLVGPLLAMILAETAAAPFSVDFRSGAFHYQPDVVEFILPSFRSRIFGDGVWEILSNFNITPNIETEVSLPLIGVILSGVALVWDRKRAWPWIGLLAVCLLLALGPTLKILGKMTYTDYNLPVIMPYALLTELPGMSFMRTPGRFVLLAYIAMGVAAALGLQALSRQRPRLALVLAVGASVLLLVETWAVDWPVYDLPPASDFYKTLAADEEMYGVFDLPIMAKEDDWYPNYFSRYQMLQMTHRKGIAAGYFSRTYVKHPVFPCLFPTLDTEVAEDVLVNGRPDVCYANTLFELDHFNYRYVVRHKPQPGLRGFGEGSWGDLEAQRFVDLFFDEQEPVVDDELVTVYAVPESPPEELRPVMWLLDNWYSAESEWRWASSPAEVYLSVPRPVSATLEIVPDAMFAPGEDQVVGETGVLLPALNGEPLPAVAIRRGETAQIPLALPAGVYTLSLKLEAGNFRPVDFGGKDLRLLSFSVRSINLITEE